MSDPRSKEQKPGRLWILLGCLLVLTSVLLVGKNLIEQRTAARQSALLLEQAQQQMANSVLSTHPGVKEESDPTDDVLEDSLPTTASDWSNYNIAGILSLPDIGVKLPVLADYSDALLKVSVCIFDWEDTQDPPRTVITGHNYKAHFGKLSKLSLGAELTYQTMEGEETKFQVIEITEISADDGGALDEGDWDLTLLTCNFDMSKRILVRCAEKQ